MEFFRRLKTLIPTVDASDSDRADSNVVSAQSQSSSGSQDAAEVTDGDWKPSPEDKPKTRDLDLSQGPDSYSDILVDSEFNGRYPERDNVRYKPSLFKKLFLFQGYEEMTRINCERKLYDIIKEEPLIRLLIGALNAAGCPINIRRNFSCEMCYAGVYGGYDTETQQVVMCMNNLKKKSLMTTILAHELIHMFDHCVNNTDFKAPEHLACTEIRAINLTSCSLLDSFFSGYVSIMDLLKRDYGKKHAICVKERALQSVMAATSNLSEEDARSIIDRVFPICYNDLEPIGRRLRHKTDDGDRAFYDGQRYGYV